MPDTSYPIPAPAPVPTEESWSIGKGEFQALAKWMAGSSFTGKQRVTVMAAEMYIAITVSLFEASISS